MNYIRFIACMTMSATIVASAQDLKKEITIEKEIVPELRAATRLNVGHVTISPVVNKSSISLSDRPIAVGIVPRITRLDPAATGDAITVSPYRGYVSLGYFPAYNLGISAGYNLINSSSTTLNVWGQFDGYTYKTDEIFNEKKLNVTDNTAVIGAGLSHYFNESQRLTVNLDFGFTSVKYPGHTPVLLPDWTESEFNGYFRSGNTRFNLGGRWMSGDKENNYTVGIGLSMFDNSAKKDCFAYGLDYLTEELKPAKEMNYKLDFGLKYGLFGIDVDGSFINDNCRNRVEDCVLITHNGRTSGVISARPHIIFNGDIFTAKAGVNVQYTVNSGKAFHVAPDVELACVPSSKFSAYAKFGGGEHQNTLQSLFDCSHFISPLLNYDNSHIPFEADLGFVVGPFAGASAELFGGYAVANDWLMPALSYGSYFRTIDMKGWHAGVNLRYSYRELVEFAAGVEIAPQKENRGYYLWRDRAKTVASASVKVNPIDKLSVEIGWEYRGGRETYLYMPDILMTDILPVSTHDLGDMNNLRAGVTYNFTDAFSVFAQAENLLGKKWNDISFVPAQKINGLIGVSYKF